jgi:hypothetical protein
MSVLVDMIASAPQPHPEGVQPQASAIIAKLKVHTAALFM